MSRFTFHVSRFTLVALPWLAVLALSAWLILLRFPPSGVTHFRFAFDGSQAWFDSFLPGERVTVPGLQADGWIGQRVFQEPVYAGARLPGAYDRVTFELEIRTEHQPLVELGLLRDADAFSFEMKPFWSQALSHGWHAATWSGVRGFVRDGQPDHTLVADPDRILVWRATTTIPTLADHVEGWRTFNITLRGSQDFYVVPSDGGIHFQLLLQDVNRFAGKKIATFRVSRGEETVWTDAIGLAGSADAKPDEAVQKNIDVEGLAPGVYRLSIIGDDNVFIRSIATTASHWVIGPRVYFGDTVGYATGTQAGRAWTNSQHLVVDTLHPEGLQVVSFGRRSVAVTSTHASYRMDRSASDGTGIVTIAAPKGDVRVVGDGFFSFAPEAFFVPAPRRLSDATDVDREGINAVITHYAPPSSTVDGWVDARASFDHLPSGGTLKLALSAPGLVGRQGSVDVRTAEVTYERPPLSWSEWWRDVRRELSVAWQRL